MRSNQVCEFCPIHTSHGALSRAFSELVNHAFIVDRQADDGLEIVDSAPK
jgi:hypothetical protein